MRYFKAYEQDERPGLLFKMVAESLEELEAIGLDKDPLVVDEDKLFNAVDPDYISYEYGICHKRIQNGVLENRPAGEITAQQTALGKATEVLKTKKIDDSLDVGVFSFDNKEFPLTSAARSVYEAVIESTPTTMTLVTTTGNYSLAQADINAFKNAYYAAVINIGTTSISV